MAMPCVVWTSSGGKPERNHPRTCLWRADACYYDLGTYTRQVKTISPKAQIWFDRGLIWRNGFNHEEAVNAAECDPGRAMAH
jgi:hypothetical protein